MKIGTFAYFDISRFMTTEQRKARITALVLPIRVSSSEISGQDFLDPTGKFQNLRQLTDRGRQLSDQPGRAVSDRPGRPVFYTRFLFTVQCI